MSEEEKEAKPKRKKMIAIRIIAQKEDVAIIEHIGKHGPERVAVPRETLEGGKIDREEFKAGVEFGLPWAAIIKGEMPTPEAIANELHRAGAWTAWDALGGGLKVQKAVQRAYAPVVKALLRAASANK